VSSSLTDFYKRRRFSKSKFRFLKLLFAFLLAGTILSFSLEFIANDKPLIVRYKGVYYFPILKDFSEDVFGGQLGTLFNYRDPFIQKEIKKYGIMIFPLIPFGPDTVNYTISFAPCKPTAQNWLGTDDQGRDVLVRLLYATRRSVLFGCAVAFFSFIISFIIGSLLGVFHTTKKSFFLQRFFDILTNLPPLFLLLLFLSFFDLNIFSLAGVMIFFTSFQLINTVHFAFLKASSQNYVRASIALGVPYKKIVIFHILPNVLGTLVVPIPFTIIGSITILVSLEFLGIGFEPGKASIGELITQSRNNILSFWLLIPSFFILACLSLFFFFVGDSIRKLFNPYKEN
jgi:microcin C transport system permease protein